MPTSFLGLFFFALALALPATFIAAMVQLIIRRYRAPQR
jgi:hypothetical protein